MWAGLLIGIGLIVIIHKVHIKWKLRMTTYEVTTDIATFILVNMIHGGAGVHGVVHAAIAAVVVSIYISYLRKQIGFWNRDEYVPGKHNVSNQLD